MYVLNNNISSSSINYGAIGFSIAREMMHALDTEGRNYDKEGVLNQMWSESSIKQFDRRAKLIRKQFSGYHMWGEYVGNM